MRTGVCAGPSTLFAILGMGYPSCLHNHVSYPALQRRPALLQVLITRKSSEFITRKSGETIVIRYIIGRSFVGSTLVTLIRLS